MGLVRRRWARDVNGGGLGPVLPVASSLLPSLLFLPSHGSALPGFPSRNILT